MQKLLFIGKNEQEQLNNYILNIEHFFFGKKIIRSSVELHRTILINFHMVALSLLFRHQGSLTAGTPIKIHGFSLASGFILIMAIVNS